MNLQQISTIYSYLCENTPSPQLFRQSFETFGGNPFSAIDTVLYIPMYSWGMGAATITPRINYLIESGRTLHSLAAATDADIENICHAQMDNGRIFGTGLGHRMRQVVERARQIVAYGEATLEELLTPIEQWHQTELIRRLRELKKFTAVGEAAALHILMDLHWNVVKPDRHICRFLSRLGGMWADYFEGPGTTIVEPYAFLPLQSEWRAVTGHLIETGSKEPLTVQGVEFPGIGLWRPRHFDMIIMHYTQDVPIADQGWRPTPPCQESPYCDLCSIADCSARVG